MTNTFFFYDLETSGLSPKLDRIMQFAGQRTDLDLNPIGDPINLLVKLDEDTLPSPDAIMVTKITPQQTRLDGLTEREFCDYVASEIFTPGTIATGYNSVRFDDEFMRHTFWRNFYDPYEWQWKDGRSRWDLLDVVRMTRALRPEGIKWPFQPARRTNRTTGETELVTDENGDPVMVPTNRLELITKLNGIEHTHAHDALSDVEALISVTRLIRDHQPKLYHYLLALRDKKQVAKLVDLDHPQPFVYSCGEYKSDYNKTSVAYPIAPGKNNSVLVYDLRYDLEDTFPIVKELALNKCPAVAPLGVLDAEDGWQKIGLEKSTVENHLEALKSHPEFIEAIRNRPEPAYEPAADPESALYDGFLGDRDRIRVEAVRNADAEKLNNFRPPFSDARLPELLLHYKAKNFPETLSEQETTAWETYRTARLNHQAEPFMKALTRLQTSGKDLRGEPVDPYLIEELALWYQSLA